MLPRMLPRMLQPALDRATLICHQVRRVKAATPRAARCAACIGTQGTLVGTAATTGAVAIPAQGTPIVVTGMASSVQRI